MVQDEEKSNQKIPYRQFKIAEAFKLTRDENGGRYVTV